MRSPLYRAAKAKIQLTHKIELSPAFKFIRLGIPEILLAMLHPQFIRFSKEMLESAEKKNYSILRTRDNYVTMPVM